ncbi:hypothetical protein DFH06DRAFT_1250534 [Mycena polygramma]|nr:hypothetical protein DFH06DRAFT_1250534 [Mycena polygramma]
MGDAQCALEQSFSQTQFPSPYAAEQQQPQHYSQFPSSQQDVFGQTQAQSQSGDPFAQDQQYPPYTSTQQYPTSHSSPSPYTYTDSAPAPAPSPEDLARLAAQCTSPEDYARFGLYASAMGYAVDWRALGEGPWGRAVYAEEYGYGSAYDEMGSAQQQHGQAEAQPVPAFSLLYGPHGCPPRRVRSMEAEVKLAEVGISDEDQAEWWAAKAKEREVKQAHGEEEDGVEVEVHDAPKARAQTRTDRQAYLAAQESKQRDLEAYALVGHAKRTQFRNGYLALGMKYRPTKRARSAEAWADVERRRCAAFGAFEAGGKSGSDTGSDEDEDEDGEGSEYSTSSSSSSSSAYSPSRRTYPSPYARPSSSSSSSSPSRARARATRSCRGLLDSVVGFFGRIGVVV